MKPYLITAFFIALIFALGFAELAHSKPTAYVVLKGREVAHQFDMIDPRSQLIDGWFYDGVTHKEVKLTDDECVMLERDYLAGERCEGVSSE